MANYDSTHTGATIDSAVSQVTDSTTDLNIDSNTLVVDKSANSVGIGIAAPASALHIAGTMQVGADGSGQDVIFYSDTAGDNLTWDASEEKLTITGTDGQTALDIADGNLVVADNVDIEGDIDVNGTANLDNTDIDGTFTQDAGAVVFNEAGADYDFRVEGVGEANALFVQGSDGFVGIGTAAPTENLQIGGTSPLEILLNSHTDGFGFEYNSSGATTSTITSWHDSASALMNFVMQGSAGSPITAMSILGDGNVTVNTGDIVFGTAGKGICLGVTSNTDANTLDDYEEGTWTATMASNGGSITVSAPMTYTKIGRLVHVHGLFVVSGVSSPTGDASIHGLPFSSHNSDHGGYSGYSTGTVNFQALTGSINAWQVNMNSNVSAVNIQEFTGATYADMADHFQTGTQIRFSMTYAT